MSCTTWRLGHSGGGGMCPLLEENVKAKDILYAKRYGMPYEHKVCTVFIKQNFHENGLIFVLH